MKGEGRGERGEGRGERGEGRGERGEGRGGGGERGEGRGLYHYLPKRPKVITKSLTESLSFINC